MGTIRPLHTIAQAHRRNDSSASADTDDGLSVGRRFGHAHGTGSRMRGIASSDTHDGRPLS